jgi:hypothetical protein
MLMWDLILIVSVVFIIILLVYAFNLRVKTKKLEDEIDILDEEISDEINEHNKLAGNYKTLQDKFIENESKPILIWKIDRFTNTDEINLAKNEEYIDLVIKYISFQIFTKTDFIRFSNDWVDVKEKIGYINCLHENLAFFTRMKSKNKVVEKKVWWELL